MESKVTKESINLQVILFSAFYTYLDKISHQVMKFLIQFKFKLIFLINFVFNKNKINLINLLKTELIYKNLVQFHYIQIRLFS